MQTIAYQVHEIHDDPKERRAELHVFVYDIPYFGACGIFPPHHIANQFFATGGSEGGMGPGATWEPFQLNEKEYDQLAKAIMALDPKTLGDQVRFNWVKFSFDPTFDAISDLESWLMAVCKKHRDAYLYAHHGE